MIDALTMTVWPGREIRVTAPRPEDIAIETIAHGLARQCRWNGHTTDHYSIAQHSLVVSRLCPPEAARWGLLHDAAEAYLGDLVRPVRASLEAVGAAFCILEDLWLRTIATAMGLPATIPPVVWTIDDLVQQVEERDLMPHPPTWSAAPEVSHMPPLVVWPAAWAETQFLSEFYRLSKPHEVSRG